MREIKFRAWDKYNKRFQYNILFRVDGEDETTLKHYELQQYTGLKDKLNQNEVYEHDIVKHIEFGFLKVEWDYQDTGWICLSKDYKKYKLAEVLLLGGIMVGNIYENPQLLEGN